MLSKAEQTDFHDWLSTLPRFLAAVDASSEEASEKVEQVPQQTSKVSMRFSKILGNKQSKTCSVDRLDEILEKQHKPHIAED
ncbi:hypothetical protein MUP37_03850 [Candidatus Bathyarchaeota archaeon]|nr:hypothetical protein [Candidatus Bathyarchaeota archaeon]